MRGRRSAVKKVCLNFFDKLNTPYTTEVYGVFSFMLL